MNLNTANLKVAFAAATDATRENICTVHVTPEGTEATNGHILARVSLPTQYVPGDLPEPIKTVEAEYLEPFLVPAKVFMAMKAIKSKSVIFPVLQDAIYVDIEKSNENGSARFCITDLETTQSPAIKKVDAVFPDTARVIPTAKPVKSVMFNGELMSTLLDIAKAVGDTTIRMDLSHNHRGSIKLTSKNENTDQSFLGILMPLAIDADETGRVKYNSVAYVCCKTEELDMVGDVFNTCATGDGQIILSAAYLKEQYAGLTEESRNSIALLIDDVLAEIGSFDGDIWFYKE